MQPRLTQSRWRGFSLSRVGAAIWATVQTTVQTKAASLGILALVLGVGWSAPAVADEEPPEETVLEKIARTRTLVAGARTNTLPFSDFTDNQWRGYAIDLMRRIQADLEKQLRHPIELEIKEVSVGERTAQLTEGNVDLICDATSFARSRDLEVDFSVSYFQTGTQLLFNTGVETAARVSSAYADSLIVGVMAGTTNQGVIERRLQIAQFVEFPSRAEGWMALQHGRIDALASDGILLEAMKYSSPVPENYVLVPPRPYDQEIYACMLPQDDPAFQDLVDTSLLSFMQGVLNCHPDDLKILQTWFGEDGIPTNLGLLWELFQRQTKLATASTPDQCLDADHTTPEATPEAQLN